MKGRIHSIQTLGAVDGPGIRFVVFTQGCELRCGCCHNPDTWDRTGGTEYTARELVEKAVNYREYFGEKGGITASGGEPLLQAEFVAELFRLAHEAGINTCLDTAGSVLNEQVRRLLGQCDRVLLDIKYTIPGQYREYVGCEMEQVLEFLTVLDEEKIPVTLRQVIIPSLNDTEENIRALTELKKRFICVDEIELLPFRKICKVKYDKMGLKFRFEELSEPTAKQMKVLKEMI